MCVFRCDVFACVVLEVGHVWFPVFVKCNRSPVCVVRCMFDCCSMFVVCCVLFCVSYLMCVVCYILMFVCCLLCVLFDARILPCICGIERVVCVVRVL